MEGVSLWVVLSVISPRSFLAAGFHSYHSRKPQKHFTIVNPFIDAIRHNLNVRENTVKAKTVK